LPGIRLLGLVGLWIDDRRVFAGTPRLQGLLAALAFTPNTVISTDALIDRVWGEASPSQARNSLYSYVSRLRSAFRHGEREAVPAELIQDGGGYVLRVDPLEVDLHRARSLVNRAEASHDEVARLRAACDLWRGTPLAGVPGAWAGRVRDSLAQERLTMLTKCFDAELRAGRHLEMITRLHEALTDYPFAEELLGQLMTALHRSGRQPEALETFRRARELLVKEIGLEPGESLQQLHRAILLSDPAAERAPDVRVEIAPPPVRDAAKPIPAQLPAGVSIFIGQDEHLSALDRIHELVKESHAPIVITGMPGVGKTTLAVRWAHRIKTAFPDGQLYVHLRGYTPGATAMTATEALVALLGALGVPAAAIPARQTELEGLYRSLLADRRALVLLDDAASIEQVVPLLPGNGRCLVVVTSRDDLRGLTVLHDARRLVVRPLSMPDAEALLRQCIGDHRADEVTPDLAELAQLCGNLPLALRIAAANIGSRPGVPLSTVVRQFSASTGLTALELPGGGNPSVLTSFEISFRALSEPSQRLFCLLGLMPGTDVSIASAAALAGAPPEQAADALDEIVARHLLESSDGLRFRQHDLLRRFAGDRARHVVVEQERQAAKVRLYHHYLRSVDAAVGRLFDSNPLPRPEPVAGSEPPEFDDDSALHFLADEHSNLMEAAKRATDDGHPWFAWHLADALRGYLVACRPLADWLAAASIGLDAAKHAGDMAAEATMRRNLALICDALGQHREADRHREEAIRLSMASGDPHAEAAAVLIMGTQRFRRNQFAEAAEDYLRAAELNEMIGNRHSMAVSLVNLSGMLIKLGRMGKAIEYAGKGLHAAREASAQHSAFEALHYLSLAHSYRSEIHEAIARGQELLDESTRVGAVRYEGLARVDLCRGHLLAGGLQAALDHAEASVTLMRQLSDPRLLNVAVTARADCLREMGRQSPARADYDEALGLAEGANQPDGMINTLLGLAALDKAAADLESAAKHAQRGYDLSVRNNLRLLRGFALALLAEIDAGRNDEHTAGLHAAEAREILTEAHLHPAVTRH